MSDSKVRFAPLRTVSTIKTGGTPNRSVAEYWENGHIPWVTTGEVVGKRITDSRERITSRGLQRSSAQIVPAGSTLIALIGQGRTRGRVGILDLPAATNQNCASVTPTADTDADFLFQFLKSQYLRIRALSNNSGQANLNRTIVGDIRVPLFEWAQQKRIAEVLGDLDRLESLNESQLMLARAKFSALREQIFSDSHEWKLEPFHSIFRKTDHARDSDQYPVMTIASREGFITQAEKYQRDMVGASISQYRLMRKGDFAYNRGNSKTYPQGSIYRLRSESALVPNSYITFQTRDGGADARFFEHYFLAGALNRQLSRRINSGIRANGLLNITEEDFFGTRVPLPPIEEQVRVANILDGTQFEVALLGKQVELLQVQRRGLAQRLFSGQIRIVESSEGMNPT